MKINRIHVSNYRNIDGLTVDFHPKTNYIIGENNLGKSNFLALMEIVCNGRSFEESDFSSAESPIEILLDLKLLPREYGFFGDNFSPDDSSVLQIRYSQSIADAYPTIMCCDTGESIPAKQLRKIHFLKYDTNAVPGKVLRLDNRKGAGMIVNSMIERYIASTGGEQSFLDTSKVDGLTAFINGHLGKIRSFSDYSIQAAIDEEPAEMLSRLFYLSDGARKIEATGSGVQFMAMASIDILCQIMSIYNSKAVLFDEQLYVNENGEKYLPIVLSIDEPEVHLHPFLQRSLINYYKRILCNEDAGFKELLRMCFDVDGVDGQLVIVTHSTDSLVDNYRNLIRFYKEEDATRALSGPKAIGENDISNYAELTALLSADEMSYLRGIETSIKNGDIPEADSVQSYTNLIVEKLLPLGFVTHNSIILMVIALFSQYTQIRAFYQNYYPLIIVDEFQDTNSIAWQLLKSLICDNSQLLFLGDSLQRIYGFIGALPDIMAVAAEEYSMETISLNKNYRFRDNPDMLLLDQNIRANAARGFQFDPGEAVAQLPAFWGNTQADEATQMAEKILNLKAENPDARIAILCRSRSINAESIEEALSQNAISYFYGLFNEDDVEYVDFHRMCQDLFIKRFGGRKYITSRSLVSFVEEVSRKYPVEKSKVEAALLTLLGALVEKVSTDYATISPEDKYTLLLDMFENRQLKQAMEHVEANVIITTIHGSKGLEWDYVFLSDVERWVFPSFTCNLCLNRFSSVPNYKCSMPSALSPDLKKALLDELSVYYVGITRARKQVYISASAKRYNADGNEKNSIFSCFSALRGVRIVKG